MWLYFSCRDVLLDPYNSTCVVKCQHVAALNLRGKFLFFRYIRSFIKRSYSSFLDIFPKIVGPLAGMFPFLVLLQRPLTGEEMLAEMRANLEKGPWCLKPNTGFTQLKRCEVDRATFQAFQRGTRHGSKTYCILTLWSSLNIFLVPRSQNFNLLIKAEEPRRQIFDRISKRQSVCSAECVCLGSEGKISLLINFPCFGPQSLWNSGK
jgi:hypothetical protein